MRINVKRLLLVLILLLLLVAGIVCAVLFAIRFLRQESAPEDLRENLQPIQPPAGAQVLTFPMDNGLVTAGYRNRTYYEKNGYPHYGTDITSAGDPIADVLASGTGVVLGTEYCDNSLGHIAVIRYDDVFLPETGETISLIARYYHMTSLAVKTADVVSQGQVVGTIDRSHQWLHHIHIELDTDLENPFNTPQVAEKSSELLVRFPADGATTLEPMSVLVLNLEQLIVIHPNSDCCTEKDGARYFIAES